jgi:hypothetical protein
MARETEADFIRSSFKTPTLRLDEDSLRHLVRLTELEGVDVVDWQTKGIPGPDGSWGVMRVSPQISDEVFKILNELRHYHWWFPRGIPVFTHYEVQVSNAPPASF